MRDLDGVRRLASRRGETGPAAERNLKKSLAERTAPQTGLLTGDSRIGEAAKLWLEEVTASAEAGDTSLNTVRTYKSHLDNHILPALAALQIREATAGRLDLALEKIRVNKSVSVSKPCRSILSGIMGIAVRHGALTSNPVREVRRIAGSGRKNPARSLTVPECALWLARLEADPVATRRDLPDLTRWFLGTGVRIGEAIAAGAKTSISRRKKSISTTRSYE